MKRIFVAMVTVAFIAGLTPASAAPRGGGGGVHAGAINGGGFRGLRGRAEPLPRIPQSRVPAPLPAPAGPPVVNGPVGPSGMPPLGNGL
jgi:hypothetical protein